MADNLQRRYEEDEDTSYSMVPLTPAYEFYEEEAQEEEAKHRELRFFVRLFVYSIATIFAGLFYLALGLSTLIAIPLALLSGLALTVFTFYTVQILRS